MSLILTILLIYFPTLLLSIIGTLKDRFEPPNKAFNVLTWPIRFGIIATAIYSSVLIIKVYGDVFSFLRGQLDVLQNMFLISLYAYSVVFTLLYILLRFVYKSSYFSVFHFRPFKLTFILKLCLYLMILNILSILFLHYDFILSLPSTKIEYVKSMEIRAFALYYVGATIVAPLLEETLFRGVLYIPLLKKVGRFNAIILTSFIWTEQHFELSGAIGIFILGIILGWLYERRGSLLDPIIFHIFVNSWLIIYYVKIL